MSRYHEWPTLQIVFNNAVLLFLIIWFEQSLDSILAYVLFAVAVTSFVTLVTITREAYISGGLSGLFKEKYVFVITTLLINSLWLSAISYDFLYTDFEQSAFVNAEYVFYILLTAVFLTTVTNHSVHKVGSVLGKFLYDRSRILLMLSGYALQGITFFSLFYFLRLLDTTPLFAALALLGIKTVFEVLIDTRLKTSN